MRPPNAGVTAGGGEPFARVLPPSGGGDGDRRERKRVAAGARAVPRGVELHRGLAIHHGDVEAGIVEAEVADGARGVARRRVPRGAQRVARLREEGAPAAEDVLAVARPEDVGHRWGAGIAQIDDAAAGRVPLLAAGHREIGLVLVRQILAVLRDGIAVSYTHLTLPTNREV